MAPTGPDEILHSREHCHQQRKTLMSRKSHIAAALLASTTFISTLTNAKAEPAIMVTAACPLTGPGVAACVAAAITANELIKALQGKGTDHLGNAVKDVIKGPSDSNDIVGKNGALRRFFRF
jgi:hypothetical protein